MSDKLKWHNETMVIGGGRREILHFSAPPSHGTAFGSSNDTFLNQLLFLGLNVTEHSQAHHKTRIMR